MRKRVCMLALASLTIVSGVSQAQTTCTKQVVWDTAGAAMVSGDFRKREEIFDTSLHGWAGFRDHKKGTIILFAPVTGLQNNPIPNHLRLTFNPGLRSQGASTRLYLIGKHKTTGATHVVAHIFNRTYEEFGRMTRTGVAANQYLYQKADGINPNQVRIDPNTYTYYIVAYLYRSEATTASWPDTPLPDSPILIHSVELSRLECTGTASFN